jgi:signal transduction histidine kinase
MMLALGLSITVMWIVLLTSMFIYTVQSQGSIEDGALKAIASSILLSIPNDEELDARGPGLQLRAGVRTDKEQLTFQVWADRDRLVGGTPDAPATPLRPDFAEGFAYSTIAGQTWRAFSISDRSGRVHVQVGRPRHIVDEHFQHEGLRALGLSTLLLGLTGWFMSAAVRKSLAPIKAVANGVKDRQKFDLAPLPATGLPNEVRPLVESFNQLLHQLDEAVQAERRFIGDAAHELRTPLSALYGQAEVALRASTMAEKDAALVKLLAVAERSTRLSEQLLDLARLEAGTHAPLREPYGLDEIVVHIASEFDIAARKANRSIQLVSEPCAIQCDVDEIGILLRNLVDNALRYTSAGGHVRIACGRTAGREPRVFLEVSDDGPGVPEEQRHAIFNRFHRVPGSGVRGSGIGLSLVAEIARLHDASIETSNGPGGRGFRVRIVFSAGPAAS